MPQSEKPQIVLSDRLLAANLAKELSDEQARVVEGGKCQPISTGCPNPPPFIVNDMWCDGELYHQCP